jgi:hypothetical protein
MTLLDVIEEIEGKLSPATYRARAEAWAKENPQVFALFEKFALQAADRKRQFGMKALAEKVRWEVMMSWAKDEEGFRINNNLPAHLGRMLVEKHPHLAQFIEFRKAQGD